MDAKQIAFLENSLKDDDDSKAFMLLLSTEEALHLKKLTTPAKLCVIKLGRLGLVECVKAKINSDVVIGPSVVGIWAILTASGKDLLREVTNKWAEELHYWREEEGESHASLTDQDAAKDIAKAVEIAKNIEKEIDNAD